MGEDAGKLDAGLGQRDRDCNELWIVRGQPAAVTIAVDLDERGRCHISGTTGGAEHSCLLRRIEQYLEVDACFAQTHRSFSCVGRQTHRISHVAKTVPREILSFRQGRDCDRPRSGRIGPSRHVDGFRGLHVGTQHDAPLRHARGQADEIAVEPMLLEQESRRCQRAERCSRLGVLVIRSAHLLASHVDVS
ncbi:hypothetical protein ABH984_000233 [Bradyrhizobium ottawaense]